MVAILTALAVLLSASVSLAKMRDDDQEMTGDFERVPSATTAPGRLQIITTAIDGKFFASIDVSGPGCSGHAAGTAVASSKTSMVLRPRPHSEDQDSVACFIVIGLNREMNSAFVLETTACSDWHGERCTFEGTYYHVHD